MKELLKGKIIYAKVDEELFIILGDIFKRIGKENPVKIGDIVAMDEYGCRLSSTDEITKIPKEKIISYASNQTTGFEIMIVKTE